jgi:hypothetical protein
MIDLRKHNEKTNPRIAELENIFQTHKEEILKDFIALDLSTSQIASKYTVSDTIIRKFADRLKVDYIQRNRDRRKYGYAKYSSPKKSSKNSSSSTISNFDVLTMKW